MKSLQESRRRIKDVEERIDQLKRRRVDLHIDYQDEFKRFMATHELEHYYFLALDVQFNYFIHGLISVVPPDWAKVVKDFETIICKESIPIRLNPSKFRLYAFCKQLIPDLMPKIYSFLENMV